MQDTTLETTKSRNVRSNSHWAKIVKQLRDRESSMFGLKAVVWRIFVGFPAPFPRRSLRFSKHEWRVVRTSLLVTSHMLYLVL